MTRRYRVGDDARGMERSARRVKAERDRNRLPKKDPVSRWSRRVAGVLATGAVDVTVTWGEAIACDLDASRKQITRNAETAVRTMTAAALRGAS